MSFSTTGTKGARIDNLEPPSEKRQGLQNLVNSLSLKKTIYSQLANCPLTMVKINT